jgi:wyosine [tRNA(Phe)-imidazoG37] synthetase (radical SAM superfamily)
LKDEIVEKLIKSHDIVYFSVDSLNKDIHDLIRGFDIKLVLNNIEKINRFNEQNNTKTDMGLKFVIMKMTLMKLVDSIKEAYENYGIKTFAFSHLCEYGLKGDSVLSDKYWRNLYNKQVDKLKKMQDEFGINLYSLEYCFDNEISINQTKRRGE